MNKSLANLAIKVGKKIMSLIANQIVSYLSSEEFTNLVKNVMQKAVNQLVALVIAEKNEMRKDKMNTI